MPLFRRRPNVLDITTANYRRWLRAGRPPMDAFLSMDEADQEGLAQLGDEHVADICEAMASSVLQPQALLEGAGAPEIDDRPLPDSALALAQNLAQKLTLGGSGGQKHVRPRSERPVGTMFGQRPGSDG